MTIPVIVLVACAAVCTGQSLVYALFKSYQAATALGAGALLNVVLLLYVLSLRG